MADIFGRQQPPVDPPHLKKVKINIKTAPPKYNPDTGETVFEAWPDPKENFFHLEIDGCQVKLPLVQSIGFAIKQGIPNVILSFLAPNLEFGFEGPAEIAPCLIFNPTPKESPEPSRVAPATVVNEAVTAAVAEARETQSRLEESGKACLSGGS